MLDRLRQRADALPLDRTPLRRAGLLTALLIVLLVLGKVFSPAPARSADRQDVRSATEEVSAPRSSAVWTGGRVLAILFLLTGGGIAFWLHRRAGGRIVSNGSTLQVLETHTLGPGQSLRLVACGEEVLLLSVASDGATLLRHWPRARFDAEPVSFADALASLTDDSSAPSPLSTEESLEAKTPGRLTADPNQHLEASHTDTEHRADDLSVLASPATNGSHHGGMGPRLHEDDSSVEDRLSMNELTTEPTVARGVLFPPRAHTPHQFDVRHG
ncbi:MAG: flagellar biosynthetic protein FliO [Bacteroidota bacterium]